MSELLACRQFSQLLDQTEFDVRDVVHQMGALALEAAFTERKKGIQYLPLFSGSGQVPTLAAKVSLLGMVHIERGNYICRHCLQRHVPADQLCHLGLSSVATTTPGIPSGTLLPERTYKPTTYFRDAHPTKNSLLK